MRRLLAILALTTVAAACGGDDETAARKPVPTTTTTTTTAAPAPAPPPATATGAPLTGLPADAAAISRPALVVKIDNAPKGRPQEGINQADVVVEEGVEGGITRLAAIFHSQDPELVGPVRSARSTDIAIAAALNRPLFAYSGANSAFQALVDRAPLVNVGIDVRPGAYRRKAGRPAPYNLWARVAALREAPAAGSGAPPPLFAYRAEGKAAAGEPTAGASFEFRDKVVTAVRWSWDAASATWRRTQNATAHVDAAGAPVAPRNVVLQFVPYRDTGLVDRSNTAVPEAELVGEGDVWVLTDGKVVKGRWKKASAAELTQYVDPSGAPIELTPGQTWLELVKPGTASLS